MSFWFFKLSKKPTKNLTNFCPESKKWSNHKIKAHYNNFDTNYVQIILYIIRRCIYFVDLTTFYILLFPIHNKTSNRNSNCFASFQISYTIRLWKTNFIFARVATKSFKISYLPKTFTVKNPLKNRKGLLDHKTQLVYWQLCKGQI